MSYENPHSAYIDKRIRDFTKKNKWNTMLVNTSHEDFIKDFASCLFTNLIRDTFTASYVKKFKCTGRECDSVPNNRCHGKDEERPLLLKRALERVYPDISKPVKLRDIVIAFLEEHKNTKFTFKCASCHKKEKTEVL